MMKTLTELKSIEVNVMIHGKIFAILSDNRIVKEFLIDKDIQETVYEYLKRNNAYPSKQATACFPWLENVLANLPV